MVLESAVKQLDQDIEKAEEEYSSTKEERDALENENLQLDAQIVTSPEKMFNEVKKLEVAEERLNEEIEGMNAKLVSDNDRKLNFGRIENLLDSIGLPLEEMSTAKVRILLLKNLVLLD